MKPNRIHLNSAADLYRKQGPPHRAKKVVCAQFAQFRMVVPEGTGLRCTTPSTRDHVPTVRQGRAGPPGLGIDVNHARSGQVRRPHGPAVCCEKVDRWQLCSGDPGGRTIVFRFGQLRPIDVCQAHGTISTFSGVASAPKSAIGQIARQGYKLRVECSFLFHGRQKSPVASE